MSEEQQLLDRQEELGQEAEGTDALGGLSTPEIKLPPRQPEAHQGTILSVTPNTSEKGSHSIRVTLTSENVIGKDYIYDTWVPQVAFDDPYISTEAIGKFPAPEGKTQTPKEQWGRAKQVYEGLLRIAIAQGREVPRTRAANFEEFVTMIDAVANGVSVVFRLGVEKNAEPQFANILKVKGLYEPETAANPKLFKGIKKMWENSEEPTV